MIDKRLALIWHPGSNGEPLTAVPLSTPPCLFDSFIINDMDASSTLFFVCDIQERFRTVIHGFDEVVASTNKMLKIAKLLECEVIVTTQKSRALGQTDPAIDLASLGSLVIGPIDKTLFSMITPEVVEHLTARPHIKTAVVMGNEAHICILQTALSLVARGYRVVVLADAVSSANAAEIPIALAQMRAAGIVVSTTESLGFQLVQDASAPVFRSFSAIIKESKDATKQALSVLIS
ncbi:unnamed protein product [Mycena citricolor]|uniref:Isochorismatase-like domain-containing protein n=1 Tax=Mycena citricolor TaxID=2018698 RepID=A0AAD2GRY8_9AGAR|nr:unnamed protein product [Mycena citricolor]